MFRNKMVSHPNPSVEYLFKDKQIIIEEFRFCVSSLLALFSLFHIYILYIHIYYYYIEVG